MVGLKILFQTAGSRCAILCLLLSGAAPGADNASYLFTRVARYDPKAVLAGGERFPAGASLMLFSGGSARPLVPEFAASADAAVSFDGIRVLFAGKQKSGEPWAIWEAALTGGAPRRVTSPAAEDCIRPFYLPDDRIVYARRTPKGFRLEIAPLAGGEVFRLTYLPGNTVADDVLRDGRVLFEGTHALATAPTALELYTVYTDGSGVESVRCDHARDRFAGRQLSSGDYVFQSGSRLARFTSPRAAQLDLPLPAGEYAAPVAEPAPGELVVSWRPAPASHFGLYRVTPGKVQAAPERIIASAEAHALQPVVVAPHPVPKRHPSSLGNREGANVLCLNAYTSRGAKIPNGVVAAVRVYALDDAGAQVALGQAPVEPDGSFFVQVPSERPIRFELLDRGSKTVHAEKGWFWMRRGEQRVCVGCHAGPERAPDNAVPAVLLRTTDPVKMTLPVRSGNGGMK